VQVLFFQHIGNAVLSTIFDFVISTRRQIVIVQGLMLIDCINFMAVFEALLPYKKILATSVRYGNNQ